MPSLRRNEDLYLLSIHQRLAAQHQNPKRERQVDFEKCSEKILLLSKCAPGISFLSLNLICRDGTVAVTTTEIVLVHFSTHQTLHSNADDIGVGGFARIIESTNAIGDNLAFR